MKKIIYSIMAFAIAIFTLTSCESVPMPYDLPEQGGDSGIAVDPEGDGSFENPYNVAGVIAYISTLDAGLESDKEVYVKGIVLANNTTESTIAQYGNMTFTMVDEGNINKTFTAFQVYGPEKKKFTSVDQIKEGMEVVVCGKVVNFKGNTPETVGKGAAYVYSINGEGGSGPGTEVAPEGTGTSSDPYNVAAAVAYINTLGADTESPNAVYVKGKVLSNNTTAETISQYGNMTFTMVDEGNNSTTFTAFQVYGIDKKKFTSVDQIKEGMEVVVCGKVVNFRGNTPETVGKGSAYVYSINGEGGTGSGGDDQPAGEEKGDGSQASPFNVPGIIAYTQKLAADAQSDKKVYFKGIVSQTKDISAQYGNATFYISEDGKTSNEFYVFRCLGLNGAAISSADDVKVGDEVVIYGTVTNYKGNTPETVQKEAYIVSLNRNGSSTGGDTGGQTGSSDGVNISGTTVTLNNASATADTETVTLVVNDLGLADKASAEGTYTLSDGSTLTVAKGDGKTGPTYYAATNGFRIYASNTLTFNGKKNIKSIEITCDSYNGTNYVGNATATVSFEGSKVAYCNYMDGNSGGVQLRAQKFVITYAK